MGKGKGILLVCLLACAGASFASASAPAAQAKTVWLCKPGLKHNPCAPSQRTTYLSPSGKRRVAKVRNARKPKIDCFYVYPTVSDQKTAIANRHIDPEERSVALYQAARYSRHCRVFAPMYRQVTTGGLTGQAKVTPAQQGAGYRDVRAAFLDYLRHRSRGRGVVLSGHSQGTFLLTKLVREEIDPKPSRRKRLISALLLGGNVTVKKGKNVGGDFEHVRACRSRKQLSCVVAFSTFNEPVPAHSVFGRTGAKGRQILCTNPAALGGGTAPLSTEIPSRPFAPGTTIGAATRAVSPNQPKVSTPWYSLRGFYRGHCSSAGNARVLQITGSPRLNPVPRNFGLHLVDANIALGNLVSLVRAQAIRYVRKHAKR
jgi:hypothetical protein